MGAMVQSNSIATNFGGVFKAFGANDSVVFVATIVVGVLIAACAAFILLGGVQRLASVTEKLVPVMAVIYIIGSLLVIFINITDIPATFALIFKYAFVPQAMIGGAAGAAIKAAISQGAKRGLFSNEAGMGSTPHAHALANVKEPHHQGTVAMTSVFIDTFIVLTLTALVVISSLYTTGTISPENYEALKASGEISGSNMAQLAFSNTFAKLFGEDAGNIIGSIFVASCLLFFAFSTIISWNYFGKVNFTYLFGKNFTPVYSVIAIIFVFLGALLSNNLVWSLTDMFNNLMVIPNAITLFALGGVVVSMTKFKNKKLPEIK
jgi:AGCS family alanine or glycine:cation symporter